MIPSAVCAIHSQRTYEITHFLLSTVIVVRARYRINENTMQVLNRLCNIGNHNAQNRNKLER